MATGGHCVKPKDVVDDDETSSSGSSSDNDDAIEEHIPLNHGVKESSSSQQIPNLLTRPMAGPASDLKSRLRAFLPEIEKANSELEDADNVSKQRIDNVPEDEEHYIEMNLELGVLTERKGREEHGELKFRESSSEDESEDNLDGSSTKQPLPVDGTAVSQLKGEKVQQKQRSKIEEIGPNGV
ncbi:hypothetical protein LTR84_007014 [Exophiala bonariae]|uniref:Uncharacterized protein n=1 Tax=Exophiala bonariae TaxID=1690606 RepID=A0AAV9MZQ6_9EURO|nr:hypothetical protein LTR84_007014 [Exophiala bonariae]